MITDMDLIIAVVVGVAIPAAAGLGYLTGRMARVSRLRRQLRAAEEALERATGGEEDILRAVTNRRGHARQTRPWIITGPDGGAHCGEQ